MLSLCSQPFPYWFVICVDSGYKSFVRYIYIYIKYLLPLFHSLFHSLKVFLINKGTYFNKAKFISIFPYC